ncbi:MAG: AAA family ATPase [Chloroflexia bacterium]|nr:AAA family ATPase [Chloroflexia bacterium]
MIDTLPLAKPRLILVSGMPATGKSTLAHLIADAVGWPLFTKDRFKELLFDTGAYNVETFDRAQSRMVGTQAVALLRSVADTLLGAGASVILESNFLPGLAEDDFGPDVQTAGIRQVYCTTAPALFLARYKARTATGIRHVVHLDAAALPELVARVGTDLDGPIPLAAPLLTVDTTDGYNPSLDAILAFCRA